MPMWMQVPEDAAEKARELFDQYFESSKDSLLTRLNDLVAQVKEEPVLLAILIGVGVITAIIFFWGIVKQVFKAAIIAGALSAGAWWWYFNIR